MAEPNEALDSLIALSLLYKEYDMAAEMLESRIHTPLCIRCGRCCEVNTPFAYGLEAVNAVSRIMGKGLAWMEKIQRRIEGWLLDQHTQCPTYDPLTVNKMTFGLDDRIRDEVLALSRVQCPFYEDKGCILHDTKPLVCRASGVTRVMNGCSRPLGDGETESQKLFIGGQAAVDLKAELEAVLEKVPRDTWKHAGFFPTLIYSQVWPVKYQEMVSNGQIATAKLVMTHPSMAVIFQEQVESLAEKDLVLVR